MKIWFSLTLTYLTLLLSSPLFADVDVYKVWGGAYFEVAHEIPAYVDEKDRSKSWSNIYEKIEVVSFTGRFAALYEDAKTLEWARKQLSGVINEIRRSSRTEENKFYDTQRVIAVNDLLLLLDANRSLQERLNLLQQKYDKFGGVDALWDEEYIWFCNAKLDIYLESSMYKEAEKALFMCSGKIAIRRSYNTTAAFSFLARAQFLYSRLGNITQHFHTAQAMKRLFQTNTIMEQSPHAILGFSWLLRASLNTQNYAVVENLNTYFESLLANDIPIPVRALQNLEWVRAQDAVLRGSTVYDFSNIELAQEMENVAKIITKSDTIFSHSNQKNLGHYHSTKDYGLIYRLIEQAELKRREAKDINGYGQYLKFIATALQQRDQVEAITITGERFDIFSDNLLQAIILRNLIDDFEEDIPNQFTEPLLNIFFRSRTNGMYSERALGEFRDEPRLLRSITKINLRLAAELSQTLKNIWFQISENSTAYTNDYKFKEQFDLTKEGAPFSNFLQNHRILQKSYEKLNSLRENSADDGKLWQRIKINSLSRALGEREILVSYEVHNIGSEKFVFRCFITRITNGCDINKFDFNYFQAVKNLRNSILNFQGQRFARSEANLLFNAIFGGLDLSKFDNIKIHPPVFDLGLPFNVLMPTNNNYLGLEKNLSILLDLNVREQNISAPKTRDYLGIGDTKYLLSAEQKRNVESTADVSQLTFGLRSMKFRNGIAALPRLPETRQEILDVAKHFDTSKKTTLFGDTAREIDWRFSQPSEHKILHFATHGVVSGYITELDEPALVLSLGDEIQTTLNDGLLTASEIEELDLNGTTIVLSACETAIDFGSEALIGFSGLAASFTFAGAKTVYASQWKIESESASRLITGLFDKSLRHSMITEKKVNTHPFFWAPFLKIETLSLVEEKKNAKKLKVMDLTGFMSQPNSEAYPLITVNQTPWLIYANIPAKSDRYEFHALNLKNKKSAELANLGNLDNVFSMGDSIYFIGTTFDDKFNGYRPSISRLPAQDAVGKIQTLFEYRTMDNRNGIILASNFEPDGNISLVITLTEDPSNFLANYSETRLVELNKNYEILSDYLLPEDAEKKLFATEYNFVDGYLVRLVSYPSWPVFDADIDGVYGLTKCADFSNEHLEIWDRKNKNFQIIEKFRGVSGAQFARQNGIPYSTSGKIIVQQSCRGGLNETSIFDLKKKQYQSLDIPLGAITKAHFYQNSKREVFIFNFMVPVKFRRDGTFEETLQIEYSNPDLVVAPNDRQFILIATGSADNNFSTKEIISGRLETYASWGVIEQGMITIPANIDRSMVATLEYQLE